MHPSELDGLPSAVAKYVWSNKFLKESLGLQNEKQVREWFYNHPSVLAECEKANKEIEIHIRTIQNSAKAALQYIVAAERMSAFQPMKAGSNLPAIEMDLDYDYDSKKRKINK